jgi:membrane protease subunit HflK
VVLRFGKYQGTQGPGLHFLIPLVDRAVSVSTAERSLRLPFGVPGGAHIQEGSGQETLVLTGDLYAAVVEWNVIWRVVQPKDYLFNIDSDALERTIIAVSRSAMHRAVGDFSADEVLTGEREEIGRLAHQAMQQALDSYQSGVRVVAVQMQRVTPPSRVKPAFDEVNASIQQREQLVNEANRERNRLIPQAEATRHRLMQEAEGYAARKRAEVEGEVAALQARYQAYQEAPEVTRRRLYLEAMEEVIRRSGPKTVLDSSLEGLLPLLNVTEQPQAGKPTAREVRP